MASLVPADDLPANVVPADDLPSVQQPTIADRAKNFFAPYGIGEAGATMATGAVATPLAGLAGIAGAVLPGPQGQGRDWTQKVQNGLTYQPTTTVGQGIVSAVGYPFQKLAEGADAAGQYVSDKTGSPAAGAGVNAAIQVGVPSLLTQVPRVIPNPAHRLMQSAVKPTWGDLRSGKADAAINTMLEEGVSPTKGGVAKLNTKIADLGDQVTGILDKHANLTVDKNAVASRIQDVVDRIEKTNPTPQDALRDVQKVYDDFVGNGLLPRNIPLKDSQALKQGIYRMLRDKYGQLSSDTVEAQKAIGRGFKEEQNAAVPAVEALNAKQGQLINARNVAERRALMEGNKNPFGLALLAKDPMAAIGFLADRDAAVKGLLARGSYQTGRLAPPIQNSWATTPTVIQGILGELNNRNQQ